MSIELFDNPSANELGKESTHATDNKEKEKEREETAFVKGLRKRVKELLKEPENGRCSECWSKKSKPRFMAIVLAPIDEGTHKVGVFCCKRCHVYLEGLGEDYCTVKSLKTPEEWTCQDVEVLEKSGNKAVNAIYLSSLQGNHTEKHMGSLASASYVDSKYKQCLFFRTEAYHQQMNLRAMVRFAKDPKPVERTQPSQQDKLRSALSRQKSSYGGGWAQSSGTGGTRNLLMASTKSNNDSAEQPQPQEAETDEGDVPFLGWGGKKQPTNDDNNDPAAKESNAAEDIIPFKGWGSSTSGKKEEGEDIPFKGWGGGEDGGDNHKKESAEDDPTRPASRRGPSRIARRTPIRSRSFQPEDADRLRSSKSTSRSTSSRHAASTSPIRSNTNNNDATQLARPRTIQRGISAPAEAASASSRPKASSSRPRALDAMSRSTSAGHNSGRRSPSRSRSPVRRKRPSPQGSPTTSPVRNNSKPGGMRRVVSYDRSTARGTRSTGNSPTRRNANWTSSSLSPKRSHPLNSSSRKSTSAHSGSRRSKQQPKLQEGLEDNSSSDDSSVSISDDDETTSLFGDMTSDSDDDSNIRQSSKKPLDVVSRAMQALHAKNTGVVKTAIEIQALARSESPTNNKAAASTSSHHRENYHQKLQSIQDLGKEQAWELLQKTAAAGSAKANAAAKSHSASSHQRRQMVLDAVSKNKPIPDLLLQKRSAPRHSKSQSKLPALLEGRPRLARSNSAPSVSSGSTGGTLSSSERFSSSDRSREPFEKRHMMANADFASSLTSSRRKSPHLNMLAKSCFQGFAVAQANSNNLLQDDSGEHKQKW